MSYFVYRLIPPRPTFPQDMTAEEGAIMARHVSYWQDLADRGTAVVFGPVADPEGSWGLAVVEAGSPDDLDAIRSADPAVASGFARVDLLPMADAIVRS